MCPDKIELIAFLFLHLQIMLRYQQQTVKSGHGRPTGRVGPQLVQDGPPPAAPFLSVCIWMLGVCLPGRVGGQATQPRSTTSLVCLCSLVVSVGHHTALLGAQSRGRR